MNLLEAVRSGKPFKRSYWDEFCVLENNSINKGFDDEIHAVFKIADYKRELFGYLEFEDLLADDYSLEEEKISITKKSLEEVYLEIVNGHNDYDNIWDAMFYLLKKTQKTDPVRDNGYNPKTRKSE